MHSLSPESYIEKHSLLTYINDAIGQLLLHKEDNNKLNMAKFFSEYFSSVRDNNHVLFREYSFVNATLFNRSSFVKIFLKSYQSIGRKGDLLSYKDYHCLVCMLCPDFPVAIIEKTARIILIDDALDCLISFSDFVYAFQIQFCFHEFLDSCEQIYQDLESSIISDTVFVPTSGVNVKNEQDTIIKVIKPTSGQKSKVVSPKTSSSSPTTPATPTTAAATTTAGAPKTGPKISGELLAETTCTEEVNCDSFQFLRCVNIQVEKHFEFVPPQAILKEIIQRNSHITFGGFLVTLSKDESLNKWIGKLPSRDNLYTSIDKDMTSLCSKMKCSEVTPTRPSASSSTTTPNSRTSSPRTLPISLATPPVSTLATPTAMSSASASSLANARCSRRAIAKVIGHRSRDIKTHVCDVSSH